MCAWVFITNDVPIDMALHGWVGVCNGCTLKMDAVYVCVGVYDK